MHRYIHQFYCSPIGHYRKLLAVLSIFITVSVDFAGFKMFFPQLACGRIFISANPFLAFLGWKSWNFILVVALLSAILKRDHRIVNPFYFSLSPPPPLLKFTCCMPFFAENSETLWVTAIQGAQHYLNGGHGI